MLNYFPKYFSGRAIGGYFAVVLLVTFIFGKPLPFHFFLIAGLQVIIFFYFSNQLSVQWQKISEKKFKKNLFYTALILRVFVVCFLYFYYQSATGIPFDYHAADAVMYYEVSQEVSHVSFSNLFPVIDSYMSELADTGYLFYLASLAKITGSSILLPRLIKALLGAFMCVLVYNLAKRNFGESTGRIAAVFCMLAPHFMHYAGSHLKESEMSFLIVAFVERADYLLRNKKYNFINIALPLLLASSMFFFRTVLGATALFAFFTAVVFSSSRVVSWGKRILVGVWLLVAIGYFLGGRLAQEVEEVWLGRDANQATRIELNLNQAGGTRDIKLLDYLGVAVFAPTAFVIPLPNIVATEGQENMQFMNGSYYVKNISAFFSMLGLILLVFQKKWRNHLLILSFTIGYLSIIAFSGFANSERFHFPVLSLSLIIAAYGVSQLSSKMKKYFNIYMLVIVVAIIAWSWFKLAIRA